jgi:hypothetical protein
MKSAISGICGALALFVALSTGIQQPLRAAVAQERSDQADTKKDTQGNPSTKVWVNTRSGVYHCPGTRYYGTTKNGQYATQAEAQKTGNRPAYGKYCR